MDMGARNVLYKTKIQIIAILPTGKLYRGNYYILSGAVTPRIFSRAL